MKRQNKHPASKRWCICCGKNYTLDPHHKHPKSQEGSDEDANKVLACRDCHSLYHALCGQRLAMKVAARVRNFLTWMAEFPGTSFMGPREGLGPADMAPEFVIQEVGHFMLKPEYKDYSKGCLSTLGKITPTPGWGDVKA